MPTEHTAPPTGAGPGSSAEIVLYGHPALHSPTAPVTDFSPPGRAELEALIERMFAAMAAAEGVGLAANQLGVPLRLFVYDCPTERGSDGPRARGVVINPVLEPVGGPRELQEGDEGCLSVPGPYAPLPRTERAVVTGVDAAGEPVRVEGTGFLARCLQHEVDHLDGIVYVDRLNRRRRSRVLREAGLG